MTDSPTTDTTTDTGTTPARYPDRFGYLLAHMAAIADAVAGFPDSRTRSVAAQNLLDALDGYTDTTAGAGGDAAAAVAGLVRREHELLRTALRREEAINTQLEDELGKLGSFLVDRYPGLVPMHGTIVDGAIHLLRERHVDPPAAAGAGAGDDVWVARLGAWLRANMPDVYSTLTPGESPVEVALRILGRHLSCCQLPATVVTHPAPPASAAGQHRAAAAVGLFNGGA